MLYVGLMYQPYRSFVNTTVSTVDRRMGVIRIDTIAGALVYVLLAIVLTTYRKLVQRRCVRSALTKVSYALQYFDVSNCIESMPPHCRSCCSADGHNLH